MNELRDLYQEVILDHNRSPRNFHKLPQANHEAEGHNPLCGDQLKVYLKVEGDVIQDFAFEGSGCAISKASASMMGAAVKGKKIDEAKSLFRDFQGMVTSPVDRPIDEEKLGKLTVFSGVREFPTRVKCAILPWHTLHAALNDERKPVNTETDDLLKGAVATPAAALKAVQVNPEVLKENVIDALKSCFDPEIPVNIYELGLIYEVRAQPNGDVHVRMTLTSPHCPVAESLPREVEDKIRNIDEAENVKVEVVWEPPWDKNMMSESAKLQLNMM